MAQRQRSSVATERATPPEGYRLGSDIRCEELDYGRIAITPEGHASTYLGYYDRCGDRDPFLYHLCVADRAVEARNSYRFLELRRGGLFLGSFLWGKHFYKVLENRRIHRPCGADNTFGVFADGWSLDESLTRHFFGATQDELEDFLTCFHSAIRYTANETYWKPYRITFSKSRDNDCDLSGGMIPKEFPFIVFASDTTYFGGHISLYGFYRQLAFLCQYYKPDNTFSRDRFVQLLVEHGAKPEIIAQLCSAGIAGFGEPFSYPRSAMTLRG